MSQKHLIYQFHKMVGVSPKLLARIFKFNHVLNTIDPAKPINWASIAPRHIWPDSVLGDAATVVSFYFSNPLDIPYPVGAQDSAGQKQIPATKTY